MTVYNINLGIGWASSGVEYAQAYRAQLLRNIHQPAKFVFMDMILADNIQHLTENIGFQNDEIIWLYSHFTDIKIAPTTYTIDQVLAGFAGKPTREEVDGKIKRFFYEDQDNFLTCYLRAENSPYVERCEYVSRGILVRKDYFSYTRYCTEYFIPKNNQANLIERRFYNEDGTVAYSMQMADGREIYRFPDRYLVGRQELIRYFMQTLQLTKQDLVILDRETNIGQPIFEEAQKARLGVVVHAEHFSANNVDDQYILWNNYGLNTSLLPSEAVSTYYAPYLVMQLIDAPRDSFTQTMMNEMETEPVYSTNYMPMQEADKKLDTLTYDRILGDIVSPSALDVLPDPTEETTETTSD